MKILKKMTAWLLIFWYSAVRFYKEDYTYHASALAFVTLLSLVPMLSVFLYLASLFKFFDAFIQLAQSYIYTNFIPTSGQIIERYLSQFADQASQLPTLSIIFSIVTGIMLILTAENTFNMVWHIGHKTKNLSHQIISWCLLTALPLLIGVSALISGYLVTFSWLHEFNFIILFTLHLLINALIFMTLYLTVPNKIIAWQDGFLGGLIAAILFEIIKKVFFIYITHSTSYELIYGALATIPIFLLWLYVFWSLILYCAIIINMKHQRKLTKMNPGGSHTGINVS